MPTPARAAALWTASRSSPAALTRRPQNTIARTTGTRGKGLHSGVEANLRLLPAPPGHGILFRRTDLPGTPDIPALVEHLVHTDLMRRTTLASEIGRAHV